MGGNIVKWVAGVPAGVLVAVTVIWLTSPGGVLNRTPAPTPVMSVSAAGR